MKISGRSRKAGSGGKANGDPIHLGWLALAIFTIIFSSVLAWQQSPTPHPSKPFEWFSIIDFLRYPDEVNAELRLPAPPSSISSIFFLADGKVGWAVGGDGSIIHTTNGGDKWEAQRSNVAEELNDIAFNNDGTVGWIVGQGGTILTTRNRGGAWTPIASPVTANLTSIKISADGNFGWIVGWDGTVLFSNNAGVTWRTIETGAQGKIYSIFFNRGGDRVWFVGYNGLFYESENYGKTWAGSQIGNSLLSVRISKNGQTGWAIGYGGNLLKSIDSGKTWHNSRVSIKLPSYMQSITFLDDDLHGWAVGSDGTIIYSIDGGETWDPQISGVKATLAKIYIDEDGKKGWTAGSDGTILHTENGGDSWNLQATNIRSSLLSVHVDPSSDRAWAVGGDGIIISTSDNGRTWVEQKSNVHEYLNDVYFPASSKVGWAVGAKGTVLKTSDFGHTWIKLDLHSNTRLRSVYASADGRLAWAAGESGLIYSTSNGGLSWSENSIGNLAVLYSVYFFDDGKTGWAAGTEGTIAKTIDGGSTWKFVSADLSKNFYSIHFDKSETHGIAVGSNGSISVSSNSGLTWNPKATGIDSDLWSADIDEKGTKAWVSGSGGRILVSTDGGANWGAVKSGIGSLRQSISMAADGRSGWAVGDPPAILKTVDGGKTWLQIDWPLVYKRYPAPWFWIMLALSSLFFKRAFLPRLPDWQGADAIGATDKPTADFSSDRLQFGPVAKGISRYLRNEKTEPPLTLSVSGNWGVGKSSLMQLICCDLRRYGCRPVWFNAWHYQKDEYLLAALLSNIRKNGIPPIFTIDGLFFRLRLLWIRSKKHFLLAFSVVVIVFILVAYLVFHDPSEWSNLWAFITRQGDPISRSDGKSLISQALAGVAAFTALGRAMKAFHISPPTLLKETSRKMGVSNAELPSEFRMRFAEEFDEVTRALPFAMVIVIDDLDRCQPEAILAVMESINFLVSSGRCFVILGMATDRVQASLSLSFEKIAKEMFDPKDALRINMVPEEKERIDLERRRAYARDYLEKLINLEVVVPSRPDIPPHHLLEASLGESDINIENMRVRIWRAFPAIMLLCGALIGGVIGSSHVFEREISIAPDETRASFTQAHGAVASGNPTPNANRTAPPTIPYYVPEVQDGSDTGISWLYIGIAVLIVAIIAGGFFLYWVRANLRRVHDSEKFLDAIRIWTPVVQICNGSPRSIKRFGNRIRYLAMLQQAELLDDSGLDFLHKWISSWIGRIFYSSAKRDSQSTAQKDGKTVDESVLVALGAIYGAYGLAWKENIQTTGESPLDLAMRSAINEFVQSSRHQWPPSTEDVDRFSELLSGVRQSSEKKTQVAR